MNTSGNTTTVHRTRRHDRRRLGVLAAGSVLGLGAVVGVPTTASAVSQAEAEAQFRAAGIAWSSSGGCSDASNPTCTSFEGLRQTSIDGAKTLRSASACALTITGGTETGHAGGPQSHANGYKLDFSRTSCLTSYVTNTFAYAGQRSDGAALYRSAAGNTYADEGNHWDVTFISCGGC